MSRIFAYTAHRVSRIYTVVAQGPHDAAESPETVAPRKWAISVRYFCNHCNGTLMSLKGEINDLIDTRLEDSYSFVTPDELAKIIVGRPHSPHLIKKQEAQMLVRRIVERQASEGH